MIVDLKVKREEKEKRRKRDQEKEHSRMYTEIARGTTVQAREQAVVNSLKRRGLIP